jgi:hypothetical protein
MVTQSAYALALLAFCPDTPDTRRTLAALSAGEIRQTKNFSVSRL